jgi:RNA polymerase sigma-70 factor (ECF subfamily)
VSAPDLRDVQRAFWHALAGDGGDPLLARVVSSPERVEIYTGMYVARIVDALAEDFPKVAAALGPEAFAALAREYLVRHPSSAPSIRQVGAALPDFVGGREPAWLADLARLEWARLDVFNAPDAEPLTLADLERIPADEWPALRFALVPACVRLVTAWPVHRLWTDTATRSCPSGPHWVWRDGFLVYQAPMDAPEEEAFVRFAAGRPFEAVCEALDDPEEAAALLLRWLEDGIVARAWTDPNDDRPTEYPAEGMASPGIELIGRMARGDREAFAAFYDAYAPLAFGVLRRMLTPEDAADALQDVFWELWRSAADYDPSRGSPQAWVTVRARSRGIDRVRAVRRREEVFVAPLADTVEDASVPVTGNPGASFEERDTVRGALGALPPPQREVLELAYFKGLSQSEIAARLGQPLGTVKTRMRLGMDKLRGLIGAPYEPPGVGGDGMTRRTSRSPSSPPATPSARSTPRTRRRSSATSPRAARSARRRPRLPRGAGERRGGLSRDPAAARARRAAGPDRAAAGARAAPHPPRRRVGRDGGARGRYRGRRQRERRPRALRGPPRRDRARGRRAPRAARRADADGRRPPAAGRRAGAHAHHGARRERGAGADARPPRRPGDARRHARRHEAESGRAGPDGVESERGRPVPRRRAAACAGGQDLRALGDRRRHAAPRGHVLGGCRGPRARPRGADRGVAKVDVFAVTLEPAPGVPSPTGEIYLAWKEA